MPTRLWAQSQAHHEEVRRTPFFVALAARRLPWKAYAEWLGQLHFLHQFLAQAEAVVAGEPMGQATSRSSRGSLPALASDLQFLYGPQWERRIVAYPATTIYCTHLRDVAVREAVGFVAHHYARHIEDLHTIPDLAPAVATAYGLHDAGRRFLTPRDTDLAGYADRYHRLMDEIRWTPAQYDRLVAEATQAHRMYLDIINQLGRAWA